MSGGAGADEALHSLLAGAEARLPLLTLAPAFLPAPERLLLLAWAGLLGECESALFESSDPRVRALRCGWWAEELAALPAGQPRHPLGRVLATPALPWAAFAQALLERAEDDAPAASAAAAEAALRPLASAVARIDAALAGSTDPGAADRFVLHWQGLGLGRGTTGAAGVPLALWARHGRRPADAATAPGVYRDWAGQLRARIAPPRRGESLLARLLAEDDRRRLAAWAAGRPAHPPPPRWRRPFAFWRCARDAALHYRIPPAATT